MCDNCLANVVSTKASAWCSSCAMGYCDACLLHHDSLVALRDHQTYPLPQTPITSRCQRICPAHRLPKDLYCRGCAASACRLCTKEQHENCQLHKEVGLGADIEEKESQDEVTCSNCQNRAVLTNATSWCHTCNMGYCNACLVHHNSLFTFRDHETEKLSSSPQSTLLGHGCPLHNLPKDLYCRLCNSSTCRQCARVQHRTCVLHREVGLGGELPYEILQDGEKVVGSHSSRFRVSLSDPNKNSPTVPAASQDDQDDPPEDKRCLSLASHKGRRLSWARSGENKVISDEDVAGVRNHSSKVPKRTSLGILRRASVDMHDDNPLVQSRSLLVAHCDSLNNVDHYPKERRSVGSLTSAKTKSPPQLSLLKNVPVDESDIDKRNEEDMDLIAEALSASSPRMSLHRDSLEVLRTSRRSSSVEEEGVHLEGVRQSADPLITTYRHDEEILATQRAQLVRSMTTPSLGIAWTPKQCSTPRIIRGCMDNENILNAKVTHRFGDATSDDLPTKSTTRVCKEVFRFLDPLIWEEPPKAVSHPLTRHATFMNKFLLTSVLLPDYPPARCGLVPTMAINHDAIDATWCGDTFQPMLVDIVVLQDERLLVAVDWNNSCVKVLKRGKENRNWKVNGLKLPGQPVSISAVTDKLLVTTLPTQHKVAIVTLYPKLAVLRMVRTLRSYWGVAALDEERLAVSYYGDPGGVDFLDLHGNRIDVYPPTQHDELWFITNPRYLCVAPNGDLILTDWRQHKVVCINLRGKVRWAWSDVQMRGPWGVCCLPEKGKVDTISEWKSLLRIKLETQIESLNDRERSSQTGDKGGLTMNSEMAAESDVVNSVPESPPGLLMTAESSEEVRGRSKSNSVTASSDSPLVEGHEVEGAKVKRRHLGWSKNGDWSLCVTDWGDNLWQISKDGLSTRGIMGRKDHDLLQLSGEDWPKAPRGLCATTNRHLYVTQGCSNKQVLMFLLR